jgi:hypothetical protein
MADDKAPRNERKRTRPNDSVPPRQPPPTLPVPELGTVWAEGWLSEGWPPSAPDPRWLR